MPTCPVFTDEVGLFHSACGEGPIAANGAEVLSIPQLELWRQRLAASRAVEAQIATALFIGDSTTEGVGATEISGRWTDRIRRRVEGSGAPSGFISAVGFQPASSGIFNTPGGRGWSFTGAVVGNLGGGVDWHAVTVPVTGTAQFQYFGGTSLLHFHQTVDGPTAATVTFDGVAQPTLDGRNDPENPGGIYQALSNTYGLHTVVIDPNDGPLVLHGYIPLENDFFFVPVGSRIFIHAGHSGYTTEQWGDAGAFPFPGGDQWTGIFRAFPWKDSIALMVVALGINDEPTLSVQDYEDNLVRIGQRLDAATGRTNTSVLFVTFPGIPYPYHEGAARAANRLGANRAAVIDLAALLPGRVFGPLSDDGTHPNDAGYQWIADRLGPVLDPLPPTAIPVTPASQTDLATVEPTARVSWAANIITSGGATFDQSPAGTTVGERRRRVWLDPGTYRATVHYQQDAGLGTIEVLIGRYQDAVPSLVSCGSVATAGALANLSQQLATTVVTDQPGYCPVYVRKTTAAGAVRFIQLVLDKIA